MVGVSANKTIFLEYGIQETLTDFTNTTCYHETLSLIEELVSNGREESYFHFLLYALCITLYVLCIMLYAL